MTINKKLPAVILSGGSEIVALAVAEALVPHDIPLVVVGLGKKSLIRDVQPGMIYRQIHWPPDNINSALKEFIAILIDIGAGNPEPWPTFATEDGGLRFLLENQNQLKEYLAIPLGSRSMRLGGLDKAELFSSLLEAGLEEYIAPTIVIDNIDSAEMALKQLGGEAIFKPALKPLSMNLGMLGAKAIAVRKGTETGVWQKQLKEAWSISPKWVVQAILHTPIKGEASWWGMTNPSGQSVGITVFQKWKCPRIGGTASLVYTDRIPELSGKANQILTKINFNGIAELEYLQDSAGSWRLIEINLRPWLQIGIASSAGLPLIYLMYQNLAQLDNNINYFTSETKIINWVNIERMLLAAWSGEYGPKLNNLLKAGEIIYQSDYKAVYSTPFSKVRARWLWRMAKKIAGL